MEQGDERDWLSTVTITDVPLLQAIVIAPLILSGVTLGAFLYAERKVKNPIMPLQLWRTPGFAGTWFTALVFQAW